jgi:hypothetical protein
MSSNALSITLVTCRFVGCVTSAPDGSSPRGYTRKTFLGIDSKIFPRVVISCIKNIFFFISSGMLVTLPIEVAPEAMDGFL